MKSEILCDASSEQEILLASTKETPHKSDNADAQFMLFGEADRKLFWLKILSLV
jgi:hypothetical protein